MYEELWTEVCDYGQSVCDTVLGDRDQEYPQEKEMKKWKMVVWGGLTNSCEKKKSEKQQRKER